MTRWAAVTVASACFAAACGGGERSGKADTVAAPQGPLDSIADAVRPVSDLPSMNATSGTSAAGGGPLRAPGSAAGASAGGTPATSGVSGTVARAGTGSGGHEAVGGRMGEGGAANTAPDATCPATFTNPVIWEDLPDLEVIRVGTTYYYTASSFHLSPGAPILRSIDLVHWEYIGHSVPVLDFNDRYSLIGGHNYVNGIWASSLRYRESNETFYWIGCMHGGGGGFVFTAKDPTGPWTKNSTPVLFSRRRAARGR